jgi:hypothetical protein
MNAEHPMLFTCGKKKPNGVMVDNGVVEAITPEQRKLLTYHEKEFLLIYLLERNRGLIDYEFSSGDASENLLDLDLARQDALCRILVWQNDASEEDDSDEENDSDPE